MSRRSTRLATLAAPQPTTSGPLIGLTDSDGGAPTRNKAKPQGMKRKTYDGKVAQPLASKKPRIPTNLLDTLLAMPFDMLYEILGHYLTPLDLLHLAWSCKKMRAFVMSKTSKSIWILSLKKIGMPECPSDLNEPQYAMFAFVKTCHHCGAKQSVKNQVYIVWAARLQICSQCFHNSKDKSKFRGMPLKPGLQQLQHLRALLPKITLTRTGSSRKDVYYSRTMDLEWQNNYKKAKDKVQWLEKKTNDQKAKSEHAKICNAWLNEYHARLRREREAVKQERFVAIQAHLRTMGWEAEIDDMVTRNVNLRELNAVEVACKKDLTEEVLKKLDDVLKRYLETYRKSKQDRERKILLEARIPLLNDVVQIYRSTYAPNAITLDVGDILTHPDVLELVTSTPGTTDPNHFDRIRPRLPDIAREVQTKIEEKLLDLIAAAYEGRDAFDRAKVLDLATTTFSCESCFGGPSTMADPIRYPRVLVHSCATTYNHYAHDHAYEVDYAVLGTVTNTTSWNKHGNIKFSEESRKVLTDVVALCGFDPKTTTAAEMDAADPILECFSCNDEHSGRLTMRWSTVPHHAKTVHCHLSHPPMNLLVLNENETCIVRARMNEIESLKRAHLAYENMACAHCAQTGNAVTLRHHVIDKHGVSQVSPSDIVPKIDSYCIQSSFRLWPPREERVNSGVIIVHSS